MFPGQGAQYPGMAAGLYRTEPAFRDAIDRCCNALAPDHDLAREVRSLLLWRPDADAPGRADAEETLAQTRGAQPAEVAMELARCAPPPDSSGTEEGRGKGWKYGEISGV